MVRNAIPRLASGLPGVALLVWAGGALADEALFLPVADVFPIAGVGTVATGTIARGSVKAGGAVEVIGRGEMIPATVAMIQIGSAGAGADSAKAGDEVSLVLRGVDPDTIKRGKAVVAPGSAAAQTRIIAEVSMFAEGGRKTPAEDGYRPLLRIWEASVSAKFQLPDGELAPGATATIAIDLEEPTALPVGDTFEVTEGGKPVGSGTVVSVGG